MASAAVGSLVTNSLITLDALSIKRAAWLILKVVSRIPAVTSEEERDAAAMSSEASRSSSSGAVVVESEPVEATLESSLAWFSMTDDRLVSLERQWWHRTGSPAAAAAAMQIVVRLPLLCSRSQALLLLPLTKVSDVCDCDIFLDDRHLRPLQV